ncbi:hypothetical protein WOC76_06890 [Methylocystis sp. IM3]|uniref:hypothetical protein n=1 Tax=unclassified Methylocystis TaxID=2625913 RepID=UPI0030FB9E9C
MKLQPTDDENEGLSGDAFFRCIGRLKEIIEAETGVLKEGKGVDFEALNRRKLHALLEFMQVSRMAAPRAESLTTDRMRDLQSLLTENAQLLERRLQATQEITDLIVRHIRESGSDGTYSIRSQWARLK